MFVHPSVIARIGMFSCVLACAGFAGCDDPAHRKQLAAREEKMQHGVRTLHEIDEGRAEKLDRTVALMRWMHQRDRDNTATIPGRLDAYGVEERERWDNAKPLHRERFHELMQGDMPNAERTLPYMLY